MPGSGGKKGLTPKKHRFVLELLIDGNGAAAAIRAGYSPHTAKEIACALLQEPAVTEELAKQRARAAIRLELKADELKRELSAIATASITDFIKFERGKMMLVCNFNELPRHVKAAISSMKPTIYGIEIKLHDKISAAALLAKLQGWLVEKHEHKVEGAEVKFYLPDNGRRPPPSSPPPSG